MKDERYAIFKQNVKAMIAHNSNPESTWEMGFNAFTHLTDEEFFKGNVMEPQNCSAMHEKGIGYSAQSNDLPDSWNWRDYDVVPPVKDQGKCGSCWTFSTMGAVESHYLAKNHP